MAPKGILVDEILDFKSTKKINQNDYVFTKYFCSIEALFLVNKRVNKRKKLTSKKEVTR